MTAMAMYESFAGVYDAFMDNIPYEQWGELLVQRLRGAGIFDGLVLDLGCGTGAMTKYLAEHGYDMIGVDASPEMLQIAQEKQGENDGDILYLLQDMRSFELYGTVRAVVCVCDSLNYLDSLQDLEQVFRLVNNYLDPGGLFLFDVKTPYLFREVLADETFAENREDCAYIWENSWYEEEKTNEYDLSLFLQQPDGSYQRFEEIHQQKAFDRGEIRTALESAGLRFNGIWDGYTDEEPHPASERWLFCAEEVTK